MQITRDNYESYMNLAKSMAPKKGSGKLNPLDKYGTRYGDFSLRFVPTDRPFVKPDWDNIITKRDKPAMSEEEFGEAIKDLARKEFSAGKKDHDAYRKLCISHGETVSPDRKAIYEDSMKRTGGKMNGACMFWDSKGNKTLSYNPESGNWKPISTEAEFARAREFTAIYNDELKRLSAQYGDNAYGKISLSKINADLKPQNNSTVSVSEHKLDMKI